jgi:hypothetical protein
MAICVQDQSITRNLIHRIIAMSPLITLQQRDARPQEQYRGELW